MGTGRHIRPTWAILLLFSFAGPAAAQENLRTESEASGFDRHTSHDNMVAFLDFDSDGDADFLIGSLDGPDRLLVNDGRGRFRAGAPVFAGDPTKGTLAIALGDLDGDRRLDVVHAQGEVAAASADKVFSGKSIPPDTAPPSGCSHSTVPSRRSKARNV